MPNKIRDVVHYRAVSLIALMERHWCFSY